MEEVLYVVIKDEERYKAFINKMQTFGITWNSQLPIDHHPFKRLVSGLVLSKYVLILHRYDGCVSLSFMEGTDKKTSKKNLKQLFKRFYKDRGYNRVRYKDFMRTSTFSELLSLFEEVKEWDWLRN